LNRFSKITRFVIGIGLGLVLIQVALEYTGGSLWSTILHANKALLVLALVFHAAILLITSCRWKLLLSVQDVQLGYWETVRLVLIGVCFNFVSPGAVGGDLVKMGLVAQQVKDKKAESALTVVLDRSIGLLGLFLVATFAVLFYTPFMLALEKKFRAIQVAAFLVGACGLVGTLGLILIEFRHRFMGILRIASIINYCKTKLPTIIVSFFARLVDALKLYRQNHATVLIAVALSILIHLCLATNLFFIAISVGENTLNLGDCFLAVPIANAIALTPITPGGLGTRDATIAMFLAAMQVPSQKVAVIPVIMTLVFIFWGFVGGILFVFSEVLGTTLMDTREIGQ
jgi:uncharacterized protein (TIRG00374 family)